MSNECPGSHPTRASPHSTSVFAPGRVNCRRARTLAGAPPRALPLEAVRAFEWSRQLRVIPILNADSAAEWPTVVQRRKFSEATPEMPTWTIDAAALSALSPVRADGSEGIADPFAERFATPRARQTALVAGRQRFAGQGGRQGAAWSARLFVLSGARPAGATTAAHPLSPGMGPRFGRRHCCRLSATENMTMSISLGSFQALP